MSTPNKLFNLWLFGLPCSGKTTLAEKLMDNFSRDSVIHLDGDEIRKTISNDLDFSYKSREINIRRVIGIFSCKIIYFVHIYRSFFVFFKKFFNIDKIEINLIIKN